MMNPHPRHPSFKSPKIFSSELKIFSNVQLFKADNMRDYSVNEVINL